MDNKENQVNFLRKIGNKEFILFAFTFAGIVLDTLDIKGGKLVLGLGLNAFALLYIFVAIAFSKIKAKNKFDRTVTVISYFLLSVLILSIMFNILNILRINLFNHFCMISVLIMIVIIQIRKFSIGLMSNDTTSLLYRLVIFWIVGLFTYYLLPGSVS